MYGKKLFLSIIVALLIGSIMIVAAPQVEKTREVERTREVEKMIEKSTKAYGVFGEQWVSANTVGYTIVHVHASKNSCYIKGYIKVLTDEDKLYAFEILNVENFDLRKHGRPYKAEFTKKEITELNYTWYPSRKKDELYYFCLSNVLPWDVKIYWEAWECWKEPETVKETYTTTEVYYEQAQPYAGIGALLILYAFFMFPIWAIMRWRHRKFIKSQNAYSKALFLIIWGDLNDKKLSVLGIP
ncbi:hypothetical protein J7K07_01365 [Candidatus Bathyarchaeota archaeon]|nr:hypothetical protein [Candidatus Bathyarchaeota archaeon]